MAPIENVRLEADLWTLDEGEGREVGEVRLVVVVEEVVPFRRMAFRWKNDIIRKCLPPNVGNIGVRNTKCRQVRHQDGKACTEQNTHRKAGECLAGCLIVVDNTDATLATRVKIIKPERVILVLWNYRDSQNGADGARLGVSEARVETVDGDVRVVCRDAGGAKS